MKDFFEKEEEKRTMEQTDIPQNIKIGDKEYTPEQLAESVGLADKVRDLESQWSTKIDRLMPEYTKKSQEAAEARRELEDLKKAQLDKKTQEGGQLTSEETAKQVREELRKFGVMFKDEFAPTYSNQRAAEKLIDDAKNIVSQAENDGKPKTSLESLINYMDENGIKNPEKAYKLMFENELDEWKEKQISKIKGSNMVTQTQSSAGSKSPAPVVVTKGNLGDVLSDFFTNQGA